MHGIRFMRGFKEGGGGGRSGITPFFGKFKFNKFTLFNSETDLGPDWKTKSSLAAAPPPLHLATIVWIRARNWQRDICTNTF